MRSVSLASGKATPRKVRSFLVYFTPLIGLSTQHGLDIIGRTNGKNCNNWYDLPRVQFVTQCNGFLYR